MFLTRSKKSPYYQIIFEVNGKRTSLSTKTSSKKKAETILNNFKKGLFEPVQKQIQLKTLSTYRDEYIAFIQASKSKHYVRSADLSFCMLIKFTGDVILTQLDLKTLDKFINTTFSHAQKAAALYYRTLKAAFSKAVAWEYLSENPLKKIKSPKVSKSFPVFINDEQFNKILVQTNRKFLKDIFTVAYYTGMRLGEILNMKWDWIDIGTNIITVKNSDSFTTKSKKERIIPISPKIKDLLFNLFDSKDGFVFYKHLGIKYNENFISKEFRKAVDKAKLNKQIHFHTLRHSFASNLVQKGSSLYVVKELLGHEDLKTTQIYSHLQKQNLMDAVNLL